ncbi:MULTISPECIES: cryptochrome/photolyase family protein [Pseudoalteromonas]|uniref:Deoxyribodipyrimidine photolyase n=1 Tax=Pseudoalteromonas amylolytica TaxID=1859457 RepID=A0A1S1MXE2_9GAMM|nr:MULTISPECIES: cryptochrome/photolyase family protein [Pseudoalteromonas]OHU88139.1 deoxyribodipyrimidine photolyase [Pseudoalteromonas sp. JW3]OHU91579.1 deoxyribodipyrimidine photolyase [Pseudoalteromonas amylolytica]
MNNNSYRCIRLILGDQLNPQHSWFKDKNEHTLYVIAELHQETAYVQHHIQKVCAFFCAMQHFAQALSQAGHHVLHLTLDDTQAYSSLPELLTYLIDQYGASQFEYQLPDEYRLRRQLQAFTTELNVTSMYYETEHFYLNESAIKQEFTAGKHHRMEAFYRRIRKKFNILMNGNEPQGARWNFDANNRNKLKPQDFNAVPSPLLFENDVREILARLKRHSVKTIGKSQDFIGWPVTRAQAKQLVTFFCKQCLPRFGEYQDAMSCQIDNAFDKRQWSLFHSRLSFAMNAKMISPAYVVNAALAYYEQHKAKISLSQIEGFVRQIIGWREFVRGIYWANMPHYSQLNSLSATRKLPDFFWTGETQMNCLKHVIGQSLDEAYAHHIQRLMVTGNFCLLAGVDPDMVEQWYLGIYIDAIEWVEMPNTRGMSQFADGGIVGSKAYAASGNYVKNMSDYCSQCYYKVNQASGLNACPLNSLYWRFMDKNQQDFAKNPRNRVIYANWLKKSGEQRKEILAQAEDYILNIENL